MYVLLGKGHDASRRKRFLVEVFCFENRKQRTRVTPDLDGGGRGVS